MSTFSPGVVMVAVSCSSHLGKFGWLVGRVTLASGERDRLIGLPAPWLESVTSGEGVQLLLEIKCFPVPAAEVH